MNSSIVRYFTKGTSVTRSPVITKTGWLKCQWCGASPPPDDSPLLGKSRTNMGDLNILSRPVCWSAIERTGKYAGSRYILKPDELSIRDSLPGARVQRAQLFAPVIWCCASYPTGYYLAQNGGRFSSFAAAFSLGKLLKWKKPPLNLIPKSGKSNQNRFT